MAPPTLALTVGATGSILATVTSTAGTVSNPTVAWSTSAPAVATVSGTGATATVTAVGAGTAQITATAGQQSATTAVTVTGGGPPPIPTFAWHRLAATTRHGVWGGGRWVAVGPQGRVFRSSDGASWAQGTISPAFNGVAIAWTGTRYVTLGSGGVYSSTDGIEWTKATGIGTSVGPAPTRRSLVWTGARIIASDGGNLFTSADGLAFQPLATAPASGATDLVWTGTLLAGNTGAAAAQTIVSPDTGKTWTAPASLPTDLQQSSLAWDGSRFVKWRGRSFGTSTNGVTWTEQPTTVAWPISGTSGFAGPIEDVQWVGDHYLAIAYRSFGGATLDGGAILSSPDGLSWTEVATGAHGTLSRIAQGPDGILVFGQATLFSATGVNWTMRMFEFDGGQGHGTWSVDRFLVVEPGALLVSRDGVSWERFRIPLNDADAVATWTGQLYVVGGRQGQLITSPDGNSWTARTSGTSDNLRDMIFAGGRIVALGQTGASTSSGDGMTWSARTIATGPATDLEWNGQRFVAAIGNTSHVSTDGLTWQASSASPIPLNRLFWTGTELVGMNRFRVARSPDGLSWTLAGDIDQNAASLTLESIVRAGNVFIACRTLSAPPLYSADARNWFPAPIPEPIPTPCHGLAWNGTILLVQEQFGLGGGTRLP